MDRSFRCLKDRLAFIALCIAAPMLCSAATVTGLSPNSGPTTGGTEVTISGSGLIGASIVDFGGVPIPVSSNDGTSVKATTPSHTAGLVTVSLFHAEGVLIVPGGFIFISPDPPPTITDIAPTSGPTTGGNQVFIHGTNLASCTVTFDGITVTTNVENDSTLRTSAPAHTAATVNIVASNSQGNASTPYTYVAVAPNPPTVTGMSPTSGPSTGGTTVTISGADLLGATIVDFGGVPVPVAMNDDSSLTVVTPSHTSGPSTVTVFHPHGNVVVPGMFTFVSNVQPPVISGIDPSSGPTSGGTIVTISGSNLLVCTVQFDGNPITAQFNDDSTVRVSTPGHAAGTVIVTVLNSSGSASTTFTYLPIPAGSPSISGISPISGFTIGGTLVTISGSNLFGATLLDFGGVPVQITSNDGSHVIATTPSHAPGLVVVTLFHPNGEVTVPDGFTFVIPPPLITLIVPPSGPTTGGTPVTIEGQYLASATLTFDGLPLSLTLNDDFTLRATTLAHSEALVPVIVSTAGGTASTSFVYVDPAVISQVVPDRGPVAGGHSVTISGQSLSSSSVTIGGVNAVVTSNDATHITVTTSAHAACTCDVAVTRSGIATTLTDGYRFVESENVPTPASPNPVNLTTTDTDITFSSVTGSGTTTVTSIDPATAPAVPSSYKISGTDQAYEITTTASYSGPIVVGIHVDGVDDPNVFTTLRILHGENGTLVDRTILPPDTPAPDFATRMIYARLTSLSPVVVAQIVRTRRRSANH